MARRHQRRLGADQAQASSARLAWFASTQDIELHLSVVTIAELRLGIAQLAQTSPQRAAVHDSWLRTSVRPLFGSRVLPMDEDVALVWRRLYSEARRQRRAFDPADLAIASTAIVHDLTVATRNVRDFQHTGARTFNPWTNGNP